MRGIVAGLLLVGLGCKASVTPPYSARIEHVRVRSVATGLILDWPSDDADHYLVYVSDHDGVSPTDFSLFQYRVASEVLLSGLTPGVEYWAVVTAVTEDGTASRPSPRLSMTALPAGQPIDPIQVLSIPPPVSGFGHHVAVGGDVDGDGDLELLVGAPEVGVNAGRAFLFAGDARPPAPGAQWFAEPTLPESGFGMAFAAFDLDQDGYDDVAVASPDEDTASVNAGRVRVYLGSPNGLLQTPELVRGSSTTEAKFGSVLAAGLFGVNNTPGLVVGMPGVGLGRGAATLLYAPNLDTGGAWSTTGIAAGEQYGAAVVTGYFGTNSPLDVAIAGPGADVVRVYLDDVIQAGTPDPSVALAVPGMGTGANVMAVGSVDGNVAEDLIVAAPKDGLGSVTVFYGSSIGLDQNDADTVSGVVGDFGSSLAVGDVNGDTYDDVLVVERQSDQLHVFPGSDTGLLATPLWTATGAALGLTLDSEITSFDMNGDGGDEIVLASRTDDRVIVYAGETTFGPDVNVRAVPGAPGEPTTLDVIAFALPFTGSHQCVIEWGDGFDDVFNPCELDDLAGVSHPYSSAGRYELRVTVVAPGGGISRVVTPVRIVEE